MAEYVRYMGNYDRLGVIEPFALWTGSGAGWEITPLKRSGDLFRYSMTTDAYDSPVVVTFEMTGENFTYDWDTGLPKSGTLETITAIHQGELAYTITGFSTPLIPSAGNFMDLILAGNDQVTGSDENELLPGYSGNDTIIGGMGSDLIVGDVYNDPHPGNDRLFGGLGQDKLIGAGGNDYLEGNEDGDLLDGGNGHDILWGHDGADQFHGGSGNDKLMGGAGNDRLEGGRYRDLLIGGEGADTYVYGWKIREESPVGTAHDTIHFVQSDGDKIDLSFTDAITDGNPRSRWDNFIWVDENDLDAAFTGVAGQLRFAGGWLMGDTTGDKVAEFRIEIIGTLGAADVIL